jgi:hypothetical protein
MPSLDDLLKDSMLFEAARGLEVPPTRNPLDSGGDVFQFEPPPEQTGNVDDSTAENLNIWHWKLVSGDPSKVEKVSCLTRGMGNHRMKVCEDITWQNVPGVQVTPTGLKELRLPLTASFLARQYTIANGRIAAGASKLYPLEANVDRSLLNVFTYEFAGGPETPPRRVPDFMPAPGAKGPTPIQAKPGQKATATVERLRVVVFMQLICCKERFNFDPGGALGAGRLYATLMIMANLPLDKVYASVVHNRSPQSIMLHGGSEMVMALHTDMNTDIGTVLFTDRNDKSFPGPPLPTWDNMFDYYVLGAGSQTFIAVDPTKRSERKITGAVKELEDTITFSKPKPYLDRVVRKVPGQGEFDNLHCAPTMKAFPNIMSDAKYKGAPYFLDDIFMAPFCEHDCFHIHWRWGEFSTDQQAKGWSGGVPYSKPGAPMVPENQTVSIRVISKFAHEYIAEANSKHGAIDPGTWTHVNHHGGAYAISTGNLAVTARVGVAITVVEPLHEPDVGSTTTEWSVFYWHLRFGGSAPAPFTGDPDVVQERLNIVDLAKARSG